MDAGQHPRVRLGLARSHRALWPENGKPGHCDGVRKGRVAVTIEGLPLGAGAVQRAVRQCVQAVQRNAEAGAILQEQDSKTGDAPAASTGGLAQRRAQRGSGARRTLRAAW